MLKQRALSLIEILVVVAIIGILAALVLPAFSRARVSARTMLCQTRLREFGRGFQMYADEFDGAFAPGRMYNAGGGTANPENQYDVGNGLKYRPRWPATLGKQVGVFAFDQPSMEDDRQDYDNELYQCPEEPTWIDERNYAYGYNHQFLGNARKTNDRFHNFPVLQHQIKAPGKTVVFADSYGTAAGVISGGGGTVVGSGSGGPVTASGSTGTTLYVNNGPDSYEEPGNHGWSLDPPRLTERSDRGTGDEDSPRTAVHARHNNRANVVFFDNHAEDLRPEAMGYRFTTGGVYVDGSDFASDPEDPAELDDPNRPHNRFFSGTGRDDDPPPVRPGLTP